MDVFYFITCACLGIASGIVYDVLYIARCAVCGVHKQCYSVKDKIFTIVCDILYFLFFAALYVFISVIFGFDNLRLFMIAGCALGAILYLKSFHLFVAFFVNKLYNSIRLRKQVRNHD